MIYLHKLLSSADIDKLNVWKKKQTAKIRKEKELSLNRICYEMNCQRTTARKSLDHLKNLNIVKERKGKKTNTFTRLFSLTR